MAELEGKVALVTGGSRGIGAETARRLADGGADVAVTYVSTPDRAHAVVADVQARGRRGLAIEADVADAKAVTAAVDRTVAELGRIDVLVSNAGIFSVDPLEEVTLEQVDRTLAIHTRAAFVGAQAAARHMPAGGRIISIGSNLADLVSMPGITLYAMTKSALVGMTKGLAWDLGSRGITANLVQPGNTDTDMNPADSEHADGTRARTPLGRYGTPEDVAAAVAYLAGPGSRQVTGAVITVDGGLNA